MLSNFFLTVKKFDEFVIEVKKQTCYNNILRAREMHSLQSYEQDKSVYNNNIYIIILIYHDNILKLYIIHFLKLTHSEDCSEYIITQLKTFALISDSEI